MDKVKVYVGLDVHKDSIAIAFAKAHSRDDPQFVGTTRYSVISLTKALSKLGSPSDISICHEAGPCGYGLVRALREQGYHCEVVAPSRVARRPADRIKTDRRDALLLARLHRAGELVPVAVPEPQDEAIRDLVRAREDAVSDQRRVRQRLKSFLLRHGHAYTGTRWGPKHELFLSTIKFEDSAQHIVFTEYRMAVRFATELAVRLTQSLRDHAETWRWLPTVKGLMTLRSIDFISALTIVAELGDLRRFPHPREFMGYLGLVPSEHSSGNSKQRGSLTKTGNTHVRRILVEAAWNYRLPARIGESLQPRLEGQPRYIIDIAWKAQVRLCHRFRRLRARGLHQNKTCAAIARELCGFIWDIGTRLQPA
ncbi:IS110 family transposase ISCARN28 [Paraburkholderia caffeinitolerans]|uniref:IS110 family transposase ISCARN28 n=1 Tax=Paraburkholderia caffeinitolerans TaxID=1723730 RepID=A0A6J5GRL7_9BURK|nr:IS110 family transposase [Paraburkholderia caffeinitolerans]CAB3804762.1 IS110 family transposase ISCARN28 [Paraburkholderia caffeinitolerans]